MKKLKYYVESLRLRTLPLSVSGILLGSLLAYAKGYFSGSIFLLALLTTLCLQILSNIANELGDALKGTDNENRLGPIRALQSGVLTRKDYRNMILLFVFLSVFFGTCLIFTAFRFLLSWESLLLFGCGALALLAAIRYTMGKNPYGYRGWGDIAVFLFFGWLSTLGAYFLLSGMVPASLLLPASAIGFLTTGVLNVNNMRDIDNDAVSGKCTIPVKIGIKNAKIYHTFLIGGALVCMLIYAFLFSEILPAFLFVVTFPLFFHHLRNIWLYSGRSLDPQLRFLSISTFLFALTAGLGQIL